jgi:uncharacterized protein
MAALADTPAPVSASERVSSVDMIRGFAVLGILLMNIIGFGLPGQAYDDPTIAGGAEGINLQFWLWNTILFEGKMRAIFSMLFGAGLILMAGRADTSGRSTGFGDIYLRRNLWLLALGLVHAYLIWDGDILYYYALTGLFLYPLRKLEAWPLIAIGFVLLAICVPKGWLEGFDRQCKREAADRAQSVKAAGRKLTAEQEAAIGAWESKLKELKPSREEIEKTIQLHRKGYWPIFLHRQSMVPMWQSTFYYLWGFWDAAGMMLIGMGLMKLGFLAAALSTRAYLLTALLGYAIGLPWTAWMTLTRLSENFDPVASGYIGMWYELPRLSIGVAHVAILALIARAGLLTWLRRGLAAVGQMALSNYILTSLICTTIFYGYGFGLFGALQRHQLYYVVFGVWSIQLVLSPIWLRHFQFGPLEWAWRSLTYWRRQPMRIERPSPDAITATA